MENRIEKRITRDEVRALQDDTGKRFIEGYALLYNHKSRYIWELWEGSFYEIIEPRALDEVLKNPDLDVIHTPNHTYKEVVARTVSGTLKLINDERGLKYIAEVANTTYGNDLYESVKRGDIFESSFTFMMNENDESWSEDEDGKRVRTIHKISVLKEVSSVTWGAYSDTEVAARNYKQFYSEKEKETPEPVKAEPTIPLSIYEKNLQLLKLKA